jgi:hypothetical protein
MPDYRFYSVTKDGHIAGPPLVVECADDEAAVKEAKQLVDGRVIEIWQRARRVKYLTPGKKGR